MKIRTDFITNSSSSSFVLSLKFELTNGESISWEGFSDCGEGAYDYIELSATKSPEELGSCNTIDELVDMLKESIVGYENPVLDDDSSVIESLKALSSMEDIAKITIEGYEETFEDYDDGAYASDEIVTYDLKNKKQTATAFGFDYIECEGTGGSLNFSHGAEWQDAPEGYFEEKRKQLFSFDKDDEEY